MPPAPGDVSVAPAPRPLPHPLRTRPFRLLFAGRTLSLLGDAAIPAALALAVLEATGSTSALALVLACAMVPKLLLLPLGGVAGDRFDARTIALTTDLVRCATQLVVAAQLLSGTPAIWLIAAAEDHGEDVIDLEHDVLILRGGASAVPTGETVAPEDLEAEAVADGHLVWCSPM